MATAEPHSLHCNMFFEKKKTGVSYRCPPVSETVASFKAVVVTVLKHFSLSEISCMSVAFRYEL